MINEGSEGSPWQDAGRKKFSNDDAKPAAAENFLTARKKKIDDVNAAFQDNYIYKYFPDGAFPQ